MSNDRLSDADVERIAGEVGRKILRYAVRVLLVLLVLWLLLLIGIYAFRSTGG